MSFGSTMRLTGIQIIRSLTLFTWGILIIAWYLARVLNLVGQHFLVRYTGIQDVKQKAIIVKSHFGQSYTGDAHLVLIQGQHKLPANCLMCNTPMHCNAKLAMLHWLHLQQWALKR